MVDEVMADGTAVNGSGEGNEAQVGQVSSLTVGERLGQLEKALSSLNNLFKHLPLEAQITEISQRIAKFEQTLGGSTRDIQSLKATLGILSKHIHLPDGSLGIPLSIKT